MSRYFLFGAKSFAIGALALAVFLGGNITTPSAHAATLSESQIQAILNLLQVFGADASVVANVNSSLRGKAMSVQNKNKEEKKEYKGALKLLRQLRKGMSGEDIELLQTILAADEEIYPEALISGYYGLLTENAVRRFQKKHNFEQVGNIGPKTLKKLNEELEEHPLSTDIDEDDDGDDNDDEDSGSSAPAGAAPSLDNTRKRDVLCAIVPPGHLIAPGWLRKHNGVRPLVPVCQALPYGIAKKLGTTTPPGNDVTAPVLSAVSVSGLSSSGATVTWTTNEAAGSKVYYGTVSPLDISTANFLTDTAEVTAHAMNVTGLTANTTYYFVVESADVSGNIATSSQSSFTTLAVADTTAPVISSVSASSIASTSASVIWMTDEAATSKVYYGITTPLVLSGAATVSGTELLTSHFLPVTGLTASTTYYYVVESADATSNAATSSEQDFLTTQ